MLWKNGEYAKITFSIMKTRKEILVMNLNKWQVIGIIGSLLGLGATLLSNKANDEQTKLYIEEEVAKQLNNGKTNEESV